jgi:hypothetical protein
MKTIVLLWVVLISFSSLTYSQKEACNWHFGQCLMNVCDSSAPIVTYPNNGGRGSSASISDNNGNLLLYSSNAYKIWNSNNNLVPGTNNAWSSYGANLMFIPYPFHTNLYYLIAPSKDGVFYSQIDISKNNSEGQIISKNNIIKNNTAGFSAIHSSNKKSIWLVVHEVGSYNFLSYKISENGIEKNPIVSRIGSYCPTFNNYLKFSPDGAHILSVNSTYDASGNPYYSIIELFEFDNKTGQITKKIDSCLRLNEQISGEFSPDGLNFYMSSSDLTLTQIELKNGLNSNGTIIKSYKNLLPPKDIKISINGKIYISRDYVDYLDVINEPNKIGNLCDFQDSGVYLDGHRGNIGLPSFLQSYFFIPDFEAIGTCFGDSTEFYLTDTSGIDSVFWNFNDTTSGIQNSSKLWKPNTFLVILAYSIFLLLFITRV